MALVLWSGGCDSTLLVYDLLQSKMAPTNDKSSIRMFGEYINTPYGERVNTISVNHTQIPANDESKLARIALLEKFDKLFPDRLSNRIEVDIDHRGGSIDYFNGLIQPTLWLLHAAQYLGETEDLFVGYIRGDDFWHYKTEIVTAFNSLQAVANRTGKLLFPLEWLSKEDVINALARAKLSKLVWYCEKPVAGKKCNPTKNQCHSCQRHNSVLETISQETRHNKRPKTYASSMNISN